VTSDMTSSRDALRELDTGVSAWLGRGWNSDFHNGLYRKLAANAVCDFTLDWWYGIYPTLRAWRATRPYSRATLTARFRERTAAIGAEWQASCVPSSD